MTADSNDFIIAVRSLSNGWIATVTDSAGKVLGEFFSHEREEAFKIACEKIDDGYCGRVHSAQSSGM